MMSDMVQVPRELLDGLVTNSQDLSDEMPSSFAVRKGWIAQEIAQARAILDAPQEQAGGWVSVNTALPINGRTVAARIYIPEVGKDVASAFLDYADNSWRICDPTATGYFDDAKVLFWADLPEAVANA
jgi:hypothetical protein